MLSEKQYTVPMSITFDLWGRDNTITRKEDEYVDISEIRNDGGTTNMSNFKASQKEYLEDTQQEIKAPLIKTNNRTTHVHEKILERVLRFYGAPESDVIDKYVNPKYREIGLYKYNKMAMLVHLKSRYVNGSKFCPLFRKLMYKWLELKSTNNLFKHYAKHNNLRVELITRKGLGYDRSDIWIPQNLLPMLAIWCSPEYAIFVSNVMNLFHTNPLKLAQVAIQEHDTQNNVHTVAVLHTTDNKNEHDDLVARLETQVATLTNEKALVVRNNNLLRDANSKIKYHNSTLELDNLSIRDQTKSFIKLRDAYGLDAAVSTMMDKKQWLDKHMAPLEEKIEHYEQTIDQLQEELSMSRRHTSDLHRDLTVINATRDEEQLDYEETLEALESGNSRARRPVRRATRRPTDSRCDAAPSTRQNASAKHGTLQNTQASQNTLFIYTEITPYGHVFTVEPKKIILGGAKKVLRGIIFININYSDAVNMINNKNNLAKYCRRAGNEYTLNSDTCTEVFERIINNILDGVITHKSTSHGYRITAKDCVCCY